MMSPPTFESQRIRRARLAALLCGLLAVGLAEAAAADLYKWVDAKGQTHYSDLPPDDAARDQIKPMVIQTIAAPAPDASPAASTQTTKAAAGGAATKATAAGKAAKTALSGKVLGVEMPDDSPEAKQRRADDCGRVKSEAALLGQDRRVFTLDANGERQYLDDATRSARLAELQQSISSDCQ